MTLLVVISIDHARIQTIFCLVFNSDISCTVSEVLYLMFFLEYAKVQQYFNLWVSHARSWS